MKKSYLFSFLILLFLSFFCLKASSQVASEIDSKSILPPRYANLGAITAGISIPKAGMLVFNLATNTNWSYNGTAWVEIASGGLSPWQSSVNDIFNTNSGSVVIGGSSPQPTAVLDVQSNNKGILIPRMNTVNRNLISSPANSLMVYDTDLNAFYFYKKDHWVTVNGEANQELMPKVPSKYMSISKPDENCSGLIADINDNGTIALAYYIFNKNELCIKIYSSGMWITDYISTSISNDYKIAINNNNRVIITYLENVSTFNRVKYKMYDGTTWQSLPTVASPGFSSASNVNVVLNNNNKAYISWKQNDAVCSRLFLSSFDGTTWTHPENYFNYFNPHWDTPSNNHPVLRGDIGISDNNKAVISWAQSISSNDYIFKADFNGTSWTKPSSSSNNIGIKPPATSDYYYNLSNLKVRMSPNSDVSILVNWTGYPFNSGQAEKQLIKVSINRNGVWYINTISQDLDVFSGGYFNFGQLLNDKIGNFYFSYKYGSFGYPISLILNEISNLTALSKIFTEQESGLSIVKSIVGFDINSSKNALFAIFSDLNTNPNYQIFAAKRNLNNNNYLIEDLKHQEYLNENPSTVLIEGVPLISENNVSSALAWIQSDGSKNRVYISIKE